MLFGVERSASGVACRPTPAFQVLPPLFVTTLITPPVERPYSAP